MRLVARSIPLLILPTLLAPVTHAQRFTELGRTDHLPPLRLDVVDAASGDLDGDGAPDLVVLESDRIRVLRNSGYATFTELTTIPVTPAARTGAVALLDLDGDDDLDVVFALQGAAAGILRNDGPLGFVALPSPVSGPVRGLAIADIDGDGDDDVFAAMSLAPGVAGTNAPQSRLYRNDAGVLVDVTATHLPVEQKNASCAAFLDADADGDLDLLCGMAAHYLGPPPANELWLNDGAGHFTRAANALPNDLLDDQDLATGDVDGDGDVDFVSAASNAGAPGALFRNDGTGAFTADPAAMPGMDAPVPESVVLVDLDGDGDLDLASGVIAPTSRLELLRNDGHGAFSPWQTHAQNDAMQRLVALDADRDGRPDLFLGNRLASGLPQRGRLLLNHPTAGFLDAAEPITLAAHSPLNLAESVAATDIDADGDVDLLVAGDATTPLLLLLGAGDGAFDDVTATHLPPLSGANRGFGVVDLDGDGPDDVWIALQTGLTTRLVLLVGDSAGVLTELPAIAVPAFAGGMLGLAAADLDGDGKQDLLVQDSYGLHPWHGTAPLAWQADTRSTFASGLGVFALGDLDGDGLADVAAKRAAHLPTDVVEVYRNAGDGSFSLWRTLQLPAITVFRSGSVAIADADMDGDQDVFVLANEPELFVNDGAGSFAPAPASAFPLPSAYRRSKVIDVDGDGAPDVLCAAYITPQDPATRPVRQRRQRTLPRRVRDDARRRPSRVGLRVRGGRRRHGRRHGPRHRRAGDRSAGADGPRSTAPAAVARAPRTSRTSRTGRSAGRTGAPALVAGRHPAAVATLRHAVPRSGHAHCAAADRVAAGRTHELRLLHPRRTGSRRPSAACTGVPLRRAQHWGNHTATTPTR